jgi:ribosomal protein L35
MATLLRAFASYYKMKTHSGLKKRAKITGTLWDKHFFFYPIGKRHLNECKSRSNLKRKKNPKELTSYGNVKRLKVLMPYWNFARYNG